MKYFIAPINFSEWSKGFFNALRNFPYCPFVENFYGTKAMEKGDMLFLYFVNEKDGVESGIYGNGTVISDGYPECEKGRCCVDVSIMFIRFDKPVLSSNILKQYIPHTIRSVQQINEDKILELMQTPLGHIC